MKFPQQFLLATLVPAIFSVPAMLNAEQIVNVGDTFKCYFIDEGETGRSDTAAQLRITASSATWTSEQIRAATSALTTWDNLIGNTPGRTLTVGLYWENISGNTLAYAGSNYFYYKTPGLQKVSTFAEDIWKNGSIRADNETSYDIYIVCNSGQTNFYFGEVPFTGGSSTGKWDFQSVLTHEIGHGLGFLSMTTSAGTFQTVQDSAGNSPTLYTAFDELMTDESGTKLIDKAKADPSAVVFTAGEKILLEGTNLTVYNPTTWAVGSSMSHVDSVSDPDALMQYSLLNDISRRSLTEAEIGLMRQMGWLMIPEPSFFGLLAGTLALVLAGTRRRRNA